MPDAESNKSAAPILIGAVAIVAGITGCNAPEQSAKPSAAAPPTAESQPIVVVDIQRPLYRPLLMSEGDLRYVRDKADELAAASKLAKLTDDSANEVRIWQTWATFGPSPGYDTIGYIITASGISRCKIDYPSGGQPPFAGTCAMVRGESLGFDVARFLEPLLPYANTSMGCGVYDGVWYDLDIVHDAKRFVLTASNPDECRDGGSAAVLALIEGVHQERR